MKRFALVFVSLMAFAQTGQISDQNRLKVLAAYQRALLTQNAYQNAQNTACAKDKACQESQVKFQSAITGYQEIQKAVAAAEKLPEGTVFEVNTDSGTVTVKK